MSQSRWGEWMASRFEWSKQNGSIIYDRVEVKPQSVLDFQA